MNARDNFTVSMPSDRQTVVTRALEATALRVFEAWTDPKQVPQWMLGPDGWSMPICEVDLRPGGNWHFVWRKSTGQQMEMHGTYKDVSSPHRLVSTENWGGPFPETLNTITLAEKDGVTTVTVSILYPSKDAREAALKTGMTQGMALSFDRLAKHLCSIESK